MNRWLLVWVPVFLVGCALFDSPKDKPASASKKVSTPSAEVQPQLRNRLVVLPFLDREERRSENLRRRAREKFVKELVRSGSMVIVDAEEMKLHFPDFIKKSEYDYSKLSRQALSLGIPVLLEGQIMNIRVKRAADEVGVLRQVKSNFEVQVRLRMVSSKSQKDILNVTKTVTIEESGIRVAENATVDSLMASDPELIERLVSEAFLEFQDQIRKTMEKMNWEGRIAAVQGERYFLNVGQLSGLQMGDILKVTEDGDDIYDPQTGSFIGRAAGRVKGTLEVISYFGQDGSVAVVHSGAGFKENDRVELY